MKFKSLLFISLTTFCLQSKEVIQLRENFLKERVQFFQELFVGEVIAPKGANETLKQQTGKVVIEHKIHNYNPDKKLLEKNINNVLMMEEECGAVYDKDIQKMVKQDLRFWAWRVQFKMNCRKLWKEIKSLGGK